MGSASSVGQAGLGHVWLGRMGKSALGDAGRGGQGKARPRMAGPVRRNQGTAVSPGAADFFCGRTPSQSKNGSV